MEQRELVEQIVGLIQALSPDESMLLQKVLEESDMKLIALSYYHYLKAAADVAPRVKPAYAPAHTHTPPWGGLAGAVTPPKPEDPEKMKELLRALFEKRHEGS